MFYAELLAGCDNFKCPLISTWHIDGVGQSTFGPPCVLTGRCITALKWK